MNQIRLQTDSFIRPLLTEGDLGAGEEALLPPPPSSTAKLSPLSWTAADLWAGERLQVSLWHQAWNLLHSPGCP